jgi:hypothetical protein
MYFQQRTIELLLPSMNLIELTGISTLKCIHEQARVEPGVFFLRKAILI